MVDLLSSVQRSNRFNSMNYKAVSIEQMLPKTGFNKYSVQYVDDWIRTDKIAKSVLATQKAISVQAKKTEIIPEETESDLMGIKSILQVMSTQLQKLNQSASELAKNVEKGQEEGGDEGKQKKGKKKEN